MSVAQRWNAMTAARRLIIVAAVGMALLFSWAAFAEVDQITRGTGKVIPSSKAQLVQPAEPSVVAEILVRNGQSVKKGDLLVRLDDSQSASALGELQTENERLQARAQRLDTEASGGTLGCETGTACAEERRLAQARADTARAREASLASAVEQRRRDLSEAQATATSLESSLRLAREQVSMLEPLAARNIVPQTDLLQAQRDVVDLQGRLSAARQAAGRASAAIRQAQADLSQARADFRQQALAERSEISTRIAVNEESIRGAAARRDRNELRAPSDGVVNDLQVSTQGGFVNAGEQIMQIVPVGDKLLIEARISPSDRAFVKVGDNANVKVTAYDFSIYGGMKGKVVQVSADSIFDEVEREAYYAVVIETDAAFIEKGGVRLPIVPGMICDVEILTARRSVLSYLFKPVNRAFDRAMTER
ncbi:HlyD family type I secretion periplasmic adaptor subunit [Qipengyuania sp. 1NDW9]|uniref:Membrane fusion protein (MFP) family protein n=1 Tax=Qipengyuania aquimaris TaxID=255984 RepID=A0A9Q3RYC1_9SPHN|nr:MULTISPECIES: HlyD family type I secretion periplasmic adaptor subunit [Qipengyuania]MBX7494087.1 HlyD family type I secretion periplasmic adaptor subunit [Qipengyuania xiapuensis]MBY6129770.1 HlyD family type I secretion periplasmic adaptor subunit [Qipengyuania aquimaris]MBY6216724.1 HlyD family type I secretion periplasmic adaptor subunit [Qipengyuania aquimaris]UOR16412.1 HlyD family type I secretion periplasmic adaptor subunit [Qipengyuania aquimaris]